MLKPAIISPDFLKELVEDGNSREKFKNFYIKEIEPYKNQILFLLDDKENTIKKEYEKIIKEVADAHPVQIFIRDCLLPIKNESHPGIFDINQLNEHVEKFNFEVILIKNKKDIEKSLNLRKVKQHCAFPISLDKFNEIFSEFTRFANKILIIDPYLITHLTNVDCGKKNFNYSKDFGIPNIDFMINEIKNNINFKPNFSIQMKEKADYKISLKKIIDIINNNNINLNKLNEDGALGPKIEIISSIPNDCYIGINQKIKKLNKSIEEESDQLKKGKFQELLYQIEEAFFKKPIKETIANLFKWNVNLKLKTIRHTGEDGKEMRIYYRSMHINGNQIRGTLECKPGFNFFSSSNNKLKTSDEYAIELIVDDPNWIKVLQRGKYFPDFTPKKST